MREVDGTRFVTGEVDLSVADTLAEALNGQRVLVDMTGVTFIDSTGTSANRNPPGPGSGGFLKVRTETPIMSLAR